MSTTPTPTTKKPWTVTDFLFWGFGILAGVICLWMLVGISLLMYRVNRLTTTVQFDLQKPLLELTDEVALSYARQAMVIDGDNPDDWELRDNDLANLPPEQKGQPRLPDRIQSDPSRTSIGLIHKETKKRRRVIIENSGKTLTVRLQKFEDFYH